MSVALVQQQTGSTTGTTLSVPITSTRNNTLICLAFSGTVSGVSDSAGNTWTLVKAVSGFSVQTACYVAADAAAVTSVTITAGSSALILASVTEWSGLNGASPVDVSNSHANGLGTTSTTNAITTTLANDLILAAAGWGASGATDATRTTSGYTNLTAPTGTHTGTTFFLDSAYQLNAAVGSYSVSWSLPTTAASNDIIVGFAAATTQIYDETAGSTTIHATGAGVDHASDNELSGQTAIHASTSGTDGPAYVETAGGVPIVATLSGTDAIVIPPPPPVPPLTIQLTNNGRTSLVLTVTQPTVALVAASRITADIDPAAPTTVAVEPSRTQATLKR